MYSVDVLPRILSYAEKFTIDNDRMLYRDLFRVIEEYCADNRLIVGGSIGIDLISKRPYNRENFVYDVFCKEQVWKTACSIADALYSAHMTHLDPSTLKAHTIVKGVEASLFINSRELLRVHSLPHIKTADIVDLLNPISLRGYFAERELLCMPPDVYLCDVYRRLYRPYPPISGYPSYSTLLKIEEVLSRHRADGGSDTPPVSESPLETLQAGGDHETETAECDIDYGPEDINEYMERDDEIVDGSAESSAGSYANWRQRIDNIVIEHVLRDSPYVLVGDYAFPGSGAHRRLQFIFDGDIDGMIKRIDTATHAEGVNGRFTYIKYDLQLPNDFQTAKYTVYGADPNGKRVSLIDIYDSASFELVPFAKSHTGPLAGIRIAGSFVLLRFKMIDLYVFKFISALSGNKDDTRMRNIRAQIASLRKKTIAMVSENPESVFQLGDHYGQYLDENAEKKRREIESRVGTLPDYYPYVAGKK